MSNIEIAASAAEVFCKRSYPIDCTGDCVAGDEIRYQEVVYKGVYPKQTPTGKRWIYGVILSESYGKEKQQHTFKLKVLFSSGVDALEPGRIVQRKGRNVYARGTRRKLWPHEDMRELALHEKHARGDAARLARAERLSITHDQTRFLEEKAWGCGVGNCQALPSSSHGNVHQPSLFVDW